MTIRVLVADDQALVRGGFRAILDGADGIEVVAEASDGAQAVEAARATRPDVAVVDVRMPVLGGVEAMRGIVAAVPSCRVIALTTFDLDQVVRDAFTAGATGFLTKTVSPEELVAAVRTAAAGDALLAPALTRRLVERFLVAESPAARAALATLTDRERDVLRRMARGASNADIGAELFLSAGTVKTHVGRILAKLGARDRVGAVVVAYDGGLVQPGASA